MKFTAKETKTINTTVTPCSRPRFNSRDLNESLLAAARISLHRNATMQIIATQCGYTIVNFSNNPTPSGSFYQVEGKTVTLFERA